MQNKNITICTCSSRSFMDKNKIAEIAVTMEDNGFSVTLVPDLCKKVMQKSPDMQEIASSTIIACHSRVIRSHFNWLNLEANHIVNIRSFGSEDILKQLNIRSSVPNKASEKNKYHEMMASFPVENGTDAWYPVIDKDRCTECGKCHDFCLFGVYDVIDGNISVVQPQNCKNDCPACARTCPAKAIIFPKYPKSPVNGGTDDEEVFSQEDMNNMYKERLKMRLQQRKASVSLLKNDNE